MNKRGNGTSLIQSDTVRIILLVALFLLLFFLIKNATRMEKFNGLRADDLALTIDSVFIPKGDVAMDYEMGMESREIKFYGNELGTYVDDPIREQRNFILLDGNYVFESRDINTHLLGITKQGDRVVVE